MPLDHSLTYRVHSFRNLVHQKRLRDIEREVRRLDLPPGLVYADFGCSNGFVTERVGRLIAAGRVFGFDHLEDHLATGRERHPAISFARIDLNRHGTKLPSCGFVTCFETLEHVGSLETALENLLRAMGPGTVALFTVPIEIGCRGLLKFVVKVALYRYSLAELPQRSNLFWAYLWALLAGARLGCFRDRRQGWSTHFGFDYRELDDSLHRRSVRFVAFNRGFTRFYIVQTSSRSRSVPGGSRHLRAGKAGLGCRA